MGQAREVMDGITAAIMSGDRAAIERLYASDAVVEAPDVPRIEGAAAIADYHLSLHRGFPDAGWESRSSIEVGDIAIDEGWFVGTHTDVLSTPDGDLPPTGRAVRARAFDICEVQDGRCVSHRMYYDQLDLLAQLGLAESTTGAAPVPQPRNATDAAVDQPIIA
ncbi:MAG: ester cyclase [Blastococcus sp.]|nr:ester cyclase [Blastococcus sp.]